MDMKIFYKAIQSAENVLADIKVAVASREKQDAELYNACIYDAKKHVKELKAWVTLMRFEEVENENKK